MTGTRTFGITDLAELVGIQPMQLNKFIERKKYGIVQAGRGRGQDRRFSQADVFGIALVWWLFETGLRSEAIQLVLNYVCGDGRSGRPQSRANDAARILISRGIERLAITREPRIAPAKHPTQVTYLFNVAQAAQLVEGTATAIVLIIPVGSLLARLQKMMEGN